METTYLIMGADGNRYGPATLPQMREWIASRRVGPETQVFRSDQTAWLPALGFAELGLQPAAATPADVPAIASPASTPTELQALEARVKSGASWFYWIAGLSLINSISAISGSGYGFIVGLGITQVFDAIGKGVGVAGTVLALGLDVLAAAVLVMFGIFSNRKHAWAFIIGMGLYGLDGLIFLLAQDWLALGFHAFALFCIFNGFQAMRQCHAISRPAVAT